LWLAHAVEALALKLPVGVVGRAFGLDDLALPWLEELAVKIDVVTLFPDMFAGFGRLGVVGRSIVRGEVELALHDLRAFGHGKHKNVDDTPYGGGAGMLLRVDVVVPCMEAIAAKRPVPPRRILLSPKGRRFDQRQAERLAAEPGLMLLCGRYEGFDERVRAHVDEELSIGDFVLSGGEPAAMVIIDACARLRDGVLGNAASPVDESHSLAHDGSLEYPHYTRPATFRDQEVPPVLLSGDHGNIAAWREQHRRIPGSET
jgi:tRNA (guanine37-N1)-methyltransferase